MIHNAPVQQTPGIITAADYDWLVHQCALMAGDDEIAADLAQEALVEAWRNRHKLSDPSGQRAWLVTIARHVFHRWQRRRWRDTRRLTWMDAADAEMSATMAAADDVVRDLERDELATLLDRALALVPNDLRLALVAHYVEEQPQQEIAARLGISQGTLAVRLHRGKLVLRRIFATDLRDEATAYGLDTPSAAAWVETRQWCALCGQRRLRARFDADQHHLQLACPACGKLLDHQTAIIAGARSYRAAYARILDWADTYFPPALATRTALCIGCGRPAPLRYGLPNFVQVKGIAFPSVHVDCPCRNINTCDLPFVALASPVGRAFCQAHPRLRLLGQTPMEVAGDDAWLITFASVTDTARLTLAIARDTHRVIAITTTDGG